MVNRELVEDNVKSIKIQIEKKLLKKIGKNLWN